MKNSDSFEKTAVIWEIIVIFLFEKLERKEKVVLWWKRGRVDDMDGIGYG